MERAHRMQRTIAILFLAILLPLAGPASAAHGGRPNVEVLRVDLDVRFDTGYVATDARMEIRNEEERPTRVTLEIPALAAAVLSNVTIEARGRTTYGQVVGLRAEDAGSARGDATLVTRTRDGFAIHVRLAANELATLQLRWEEVLVKTGDAYAYEWRPPELGRVDRWSVRFQASDERGLGEMTVEPAEWTPLIEPVAFRTAGMTTSSLAGGELPTIRILLEPGPTPSGGLLLVQDHDERCSFVHIVDAGPWEEDAIPKSIVFALDRSGSMEGRKIAQTREAFGTILRELRPDDEFSLVLFDGTVSTALAASPANDSNVAAAIAVIDAMQAQGATDIDAALGRSLALQGANDGESVPIVVLLTDGRPTVGVKDRAAILAHVREANKRPSAIYTLGFGDDVDERLLRAIALENGGSYRAIRDDERASSQLRDFYGTIGRPLARNVTTHYGPGATIARPSDETLYAGREIYVAGHACVDGPVEARVRGVGATGEFEVTTNATLATRLPVDRLLGLMTLQDIEARIAAGTATSAQIEAVARLGLEQGLVTSQTGLLLGSTDAAVHAAADAAVGVDLATVDRTGNSNAGGRLEIGSSTEADLRSYAAPNVRQDSSGNAVVPAPGAAMVAGVLLLAAFVGRARRR